eukprot:CAMPEP_0204276434 /NCGR_PEP_ID=MMETSP0468-20130131/28122_1 /ASSEMBLY_ACC=CAM_ASM_000383 /TAXON_ID=2969 /ORGANISM="Oxyrrhis marina" /LENGTH=65 /DNA_ID=CAMNT_0051253035 /DNA_START=18 /DNA_END=215 /DNA_ORIENTATION=+
MQTQAVKRGSTALMMYAAACHCISLGLAVEPLDPRKKHKPDYNPQPYFFRWYDQFRLKTGFGTFD